MLELRKVVPGLGNSKARKREGFKENHEAGRFSSALRPRRHRLRKYSRDGFRLEMPAGNSPCRKNGETRGKLTTVPGVKTPKTFQKKRQKQGPQWLKGYRSLRILLGWRNAERKGGGLYRGELRTTTFFEERAWYYSAGFWLRRQGRPTYAWDLYKYMGFQSHRAKEGVRTPEGPWKGKRRQSA